MECKHKGKMILTPTEDKGFERIDWCYYSEKQIIGECPTDCPFKDKQAPRYE